MWRATSVVNYLMVLHASHGAEHCADDCRTRTVQFVIRPAGGAEKPHAVKYEFVAIEHVDTMLARRRNSLHSAMDIAGQDDRIGVAFWWPPVGKLEVQIGEDADFHACPSAGSSVRCT